jgi:Polyketide cyclase / dehydrase and lipid transport
MSKRSALEARSQRRGLDHPKSVTRWQTGHFNMASIHKDISIDARPEEVWDAVADFGALHCRLVPGFVLDTRLDGDARIVTFANGMVARELLVDCDHARRRLVYAVISERVKHYSASVQVFADGEARSRLVWIVDLLPHEMAQYVDGQMDQAALAMKQALGRDAA